MFSFLRAKPRHSAALWKATELAHARGYTVSAWAAIEHCLDQANHVAWHITKPKISNVVPQSFRWKIQLFERLHVQVPLFQPLRERANSLLKLIQARLDDRNFLVHGIDAEDGLDGWLLKKSVFQKDGSISTAERRFSQDELRELPAALSAILEEVTGYADALRVEIDNENRNNSGG